MEDNMGDVVVLAMFTIPIVFCLVALHNMDLS